MTFQRIQYEHCLDALFLQEFEEVLKEASLTDSLELLSLTVEEGKLGEAVQEGEEGKEVISKMEASYAASMQQVWQPFL